MFTTNGDAFLAMFRNVVASTGPDSGALFIGGHGHRLRRRLGRQVQARRKHHPDGQRGDGDQHA